MINTDCSKLFFHRFFPVIRLAVVLIGIGCPAAVNAQITFDGTVGPISPGGFGGPNYQILQSYGTTAGTNLFHSFDQFNVHVGESATFGVDTDIVNVISRVTGGNLSNVDGRISISDGADGANFWMVNPAGMMIGPNAIIDVGGSFNVGAADYIAFEGEELKFSAFDNSATLTVANPSEFGFLDAGGPGQLYLGNQDVGEDQIGCNQCTHIDGGDRFNGISLWGRDVSIKNSYIDTSPQSNARGDINIHAQNGYTQEAVHIGTTTSSDSNGGDITITAQNVNMLKGGKDDERTVAFNGVTLTTLGAGDSGSLTITGTESITLDGQGAFPNGLHAASLSGIDHIRNTGAVGSVTLNGGHITISNTVVSANSHSDIEQNNSHTVSLYAPDHDIVLNRGARVASYALGYSDGGNVEIIGRNVTLNNISEYEIAVRSVARNPVDLMTDNLRKSGDGGTLEIFAFEDLELNNATIKSDTSGEGNAGNISLNGKRVSLTNSKLESGSGLFDWPRRPYYPLLGGAGSINVNGTESVTLVNSNFFSETYSDLVSNLGSSIEVTSEGSLQLVNSTIRTDTYGESSAGTIKLTGDSISINSGNLSSTTQLPNFSCARCRLPLAPDQAPLEPGEAGSIEIRGNTLVQTESSRILTESLSVSSGSAGSISIAGNSLSLGNTEVSATTTSNRIENDIATITLLAEAGDLSLLDTDVEVSTTGSSDAGSILISASGNVTSTSTSLNDIRSSSFGSEAGAAGDVIIRGGNVLLTNAAIEAFTNSDRTLNIPSSISIEAVNGNVELTNSLVQAPTSGAADGGSIALTAANVVLNGGGLDTLTEGQQTGIPSGTAGSISITGTNSVTANATDPDSGGFSGEWFIIAKSQLIDSGQSGDVTILGGEIDLNDGDITSTVESTVEGVLPVLVLIDAGDKNLHLNNVDVKSTTFGTSEAGAIVLNGTNVTILNNTTIASESELIMRPTICGEGVYCTLLTGAPGVISINGINSLEVTGSTLKTNTESALAGNLLGTILLGSSGELKITNSLIESITIGASGAGQVDIDAATVLLEDTIIGTESFNSDSGAAGIVEIEGQDSVTLKGTQILTDTNSDILIDLGDMPDDFPGSIEITTDGELQLIDSILSSTTSGQSDAGIIVLSGVNTLLERTTVGTESDVEDSGDAGVIAVIGIENLVVLDSKLTTNTSSDRVDNLPGAIELASRNVQVTNSTIEAVTAGASDAGQVDIDAATVLLENAFIETESINPDSGAAGIVEIEGRDSVTLNGTVILTDTNSDIIIDLGDMPEDIPGSIEIESGGELQLIDTELTATTSGKSDAGVIDLVGLMVLLEDTIVINESSTTESGAAGVITVNGTDGIVLTNSSLSTNTESDVTNNLLGEILLKSTAGLQFINSNLKAATAGASGAGIIELDAAAIELRENSEIGVETVGTGVGGDIIIANSLSVLTLDDSVMQAESDNEGDGGDIILIVGSLNLLNGAEISTEAIGSGSSGFITIDVEDDLEIVGSDSIFSRITTRALQSEGGNISVATGGRLNIVDGLIEASAGAAGNGGDVSVSAGSVLQQRSGILARAADGNGGAINLEITGLEQLFVIDTQSTINADSDTGTAGDINISAPDTDLDSGLQEQDATIVVAAELAANDCSPAATGVMSTFVQDDDGGTPVSPDGYLIASAQLEVAATADASLEGFIEAGALLAAVQDNPREDCR